MRIGKYLLPIAALGAFAAGAAMLDKADAYAQGSTFEKETFNVAIHAPIQLRNYHPYQEPLLDVRGNIVAPLTAEESETSRKWADEIVEASKSGVPHILVNKAHRKLDIYQNGKITHSYPVSLGKGCPDLRAKQETAPGNAVRGNAIANNGTIGLVNDPCTPEGEYRVVLKDPDLQNQSYYHSKTLVLDYPNWADVQNGFRRGDVTGGQRYELFLSSIGNYFKRGFFAPFKESTLGLIEGIHGGYDTKEDSTILGSIGMNQKDIEPVFNLSKEGKTNVVIVRYLK